MVLRLIATAIFALVFIASADEACHPPQGTWKGLKRLCWLNSSGGETCGHGDEDLYHEITLTIAGDSAYTQWTPMTKYKGKMIPSSSDGGFFYHAGQVRCDGDSLILDLIETDCDYCFVERVTDTATGLSYPVQRKQQMRATYLNGTLRMKDLRLRKVHDSLTIGSSPSFRFDSTKINKWDSTGNYTLANQALQDLFHRGLLFSNEDTVHLITRRSTLNANYGDSLPDWKPDSLVLPAGMKIVAIDMNQVNQMSKQKERTDHYLRINSIVEYLHIAKVSIWDYYESPDGGKDHWMKIIYDRNRRGYRFRGIEECEASCP